MCGIAVALDWPKAEETVRVAVAAMRHRGDITDDLVSPIPGSAFCTRRLRIVDPDRNRQPATSWDGRILLAFNGEIYNHGALRADLEADGVPFRTEGDAELLAAALSVWGGQALQRLSGMYAFVALDLRSGEFLAARDPFGIKPLYVLRSGEGWLFASEIAPLLAASEEGEVLAVPPGAFLIRRRMGRHYAFPSPIADVAGPGLLQLDTLLREAVERHVPSEVPFATFFSGGIDSTLLTHYARRLRPKAPGYFLGDPSSPDYPYAAAYAERSGLDLRLVELPASPADLEQALPELVEAVEAFEPEVLRDAYCNWLLSRAVHRDGYRVVLAGEGADELFAGYRPLEVGFASSETTGRDLRRQTLEQMGETNLQRLDRCAMRFQVEARVPFLDPAVAHAAFGFRALDLVKPSAAGHTGKQPLRALYALHSDALPAAIGRRTKVGLHIGSGLDRTADASPWRALAEARLSDADFREGGRRLADFQVQNKEELFNLLALERRMDIHRVPHLKRRSMLHAPDDVAAAIRAREAEGLWSPPSDITARSA